MLAPWPTPSHPCVRALAPCAFLLLNEAGEQAHAQETPLPGVFEACLNGTEFLAACGDSGSAVSVRTADACGGRWVVEKSCAGAVVEYSLPGWLWVANDTLRLSARRVAFPFTAPDATVFWLPGAGENCPVQSLRVQLPATCLQIRGRDRFDWREGSADWLAVAWAVGVVLWTAHAVLGRTEHVVGSSGLVIAAHMPILQRLNYSTYALATGAALAAGTVLVLVVAPRAVLTTDWRVKLPDQTLCARLQLAAAAVAGMFVCLGLSWQFPTAEVKFA